MSGPRNDLQLILFFVVVGLIMAAGSPAPAIQVQKTYVGTWTGIPNAPNPGGLDRGGKFVIQVDYETDNIEPLPSPDVQSGIG